MPALKIAFLADGGPSIGLGHLMRSLVIAEEFHERGHVVQLIGTGSHMVRSNFQWLNAETVIDCKTSFQSAERLKSIDNFQPDLVIIDGYHYAEDLFVQIEKRRIPYGVVDDNGETQAVSPLFIVNQNAHASSRIYEKFARANLFLGPRYALIRSEIRELVDLSRGSGSESIFVSFGGTDVLGLTVPVCHALAALERQLCVAVGPGVRNRKSVLEELRTMKGVKLCEGDQYAQELWKSRVVVTAAGGALWEALCAEKSTVAVIVADNQVGAANEAASLSQLVRLVNVLENARNLEVLTDLVSELLHQNSEDSTLARDLAGGVSRLGKEVLELLQPQNDPQR